MQQKIYKIFISKTSNNKKQISLVKYPQSINYYQFLSNNEKQGLYQVPISSKMLINIATKLHVKYHFELNNIDILNKINKNILSVENLKDINNHYLLIIKSITLIDNNLKTYLKISNNGLIKMNQFNNQTILQFIQNELNRFN